MWEVFGAGFGGRDSNLSQRIDDLVPENGAFQFLVNPDGFADLVLNIEHRVERLHWVLKDDGYFTATDRCHFAFREFEQVAAVEDDGPADYVSWG